MIRADGGHINRPDPVRQDTHTVFAKAADDRARGAGRKARSGDAGLAVQCIAKAKAKRIQHSGAIEGGDALQHVLRALIGGRCRYHDFYRPLRGIRQRHPGADDKGGHTDTRQDHPAHHRFFLSAPSLGDVETENRPAGEMLYCNIAQIPADRKPETTE
jgi:hypothetical protein